MDQRDLADHTTAEPRHSLLGAVTRRGTLLNDDRDQLGRSSGCGRACRQREYHSRRRNRSADAPLPSSLNSTSCRSHHSFLVREVKPSRPCNRHRLADTPTPRNSEHTAWTDGSAPPEWTSAANAEFLRVPTPLGVRQGTTAPIETAGCKPSPYGVGEIAVTTGRNEARQHRLPRFSLVLRHRSYSLTDPWGVAHRVGARRRAFNTATVADTLRARAEAT